MVGGQGWGGWVPGAGAGPTEEEAAEEGHEEVAVQVPLVHLVHDHVCDPIQPIDPGLGLGRYADTPLVCGRRRTYGGGSGEGRF